MGSPLRPVFTDIYLENQHVDDLYLTMDEHEYIQLILRTF